MPCMADRAAAHDELARCIEGIPSVEAVDYVPPADSPSGYPETEIVVENTGRATVPNSVLRTVVVSSLGIESVVLANNPRYRRVVVR